MSLGTRILHLSVVCADPRSIALRFTGVPAGPQGYRFGRQGRFTLSLKHAQLDGRTVEWVAARLPDESVRGRLLPGQVLIARSGTTPAKGRRLSAQVEVQTYLPPSAFSVRREAVFEGRGHFELLPGG